MAYYNTCPFCGSNLDPGEKCPCIEDRAKERERKQQTIKAMQGSMFLPQRTNQYELKMAVGFNDR